MREAPSRSPIGKSYQRAFPDAYDSLRRQQELDQIISFFGAADVDDSGTLTYDEFLNLLRNNQLYEIMNKRFGFQRHQAKQIFRALDGDGNGTIDLNEWFSTCRCLMKVVQDGEVVTNWRVHSLHEKLRDAEEHMSDDWAPSKAKEATLRQDKSKTTRSPRTVRAS